MTRIAMTGASGRYGRLATDKLIAQGRARDLILITRTPATHQPTQSAASRHARNDEQRNNGQSYNAASDVFS